MLRLPQHRSALSAAWDMHPPPASDTGSPKGAKHWPQPSPSTTHLLGRGPSTRRAQPLIHFLGRRNPGPQDQKADLSGHQVLRAGTTSDASRRGGVEGAQAVQAQPAPAPAQVWPQDGPRPAAQERSGLQRKQAASLRLKSEFQQIFTFCVNIYTTARASSRLSKNNNPLKETRSTHCPLLGPVHSNNVCLWETQDTGGTTKTQMLSPNSQ